MAFGAPDLSIAHDKDDQNIQLLDANMKLKNQKHNQFDFLSSLARHIPMMQEHNGNIIEMSFKILVKLSSTILIICCFENVIFIGICSLAYEFECLGSCFVYIGSCGIALKVDQSLADNYCIPCLSMLE